MESSKIQRKRRYEEGNVWSENIRGGSFKRKGVKK
jgi:hypothetical protein